MVSRATFATTAPSPPWRSLSSKHESSVFSSPVVAPRLSQGRPNPRLLQNTLILDRHENLLMAHPDNLRVARH